MTDLFSALTDPHARKLTAASNEQWFGCKDAARPGDVIIVYTWPPDRTGSWFSMAPTSAESTHGLAYLVDTAGMSGPTPIVIVGKASWDIDEIGVARMNETAEHRRRLLGAA